MYNSPRATPRRTTRSSRQSLFAPDSASTFTGGGSVRTRSALSRVTSVSGRPSSPDSSAGESTLTARGGGPVQQQPAHHNAGEEWERERSFWSRDERHAVLSAGALPVEVASAVRGADFILNSVAAVMDTTSGFAVVSTRDTAMAWNYAKRTHSSPTVYAFPVPDLLNPHLIETTPPTLAAFFNSETSSEPGLVLASATGQIRFWESMSLALANVQRYQYIQLELPQSDLLEHIWKIDSSTFVVTSTTSQAWFIRIAAVGGRLVPISTPFTRAGGIFNRASPAIFHDNAERNGIAAVAPAIGGVYILGRSTLQRWFLGPDGSARLVGENDLRESIGSNLFDDEKAWQSGAVQIGLNDLVTLGPDQFAVLVSYSQQSHASDYHRAHNNHAIVTFEVMAKSNVLAISHSVYLSYVAHRDPRMLDVPRLYIPNGSQTAFVRFSDAILMASLTSHPYEDTISLRDSTRNAFIGAGCVVGARGDSPSLVAMAAIGGLMAIEVYQGPRVARILSPNMSATARIQSKLEQAVFFGDRGDNPLTFDLPPGFKGDLAEAAEAVSTQIVSSSSPNLPNIWEIRPLLTDRLNRLHKLMSFIHNNGGLSLLTQTSRRRLLSHAEKVKSAIELWDYENRLMDLLSDSIETLMRTRFHTSSSDDVVRQFFRKHVLSLDLLLEMVDTTYKKVKNSMRSTTQGSDASGWVLEANRIFLIVLRTSAQMREDAQNAYKVDRLHPSIELWTASDRLVGDVEELYDDTWQVIKDRTRNLGSVVDEPAPSRITTDLDQQQKDQGTLKLQMSQLASALCLNMEDKLRTVATQLNNGADPNDGLALRRRWEELKPRIIRPLVDVGRVPEAYELAEHHRDFPTLVYLCHHKVAGAGEPRIERYIEKFGTEFAFVLYNWYIENGQLHTLLTQPEVYAPLLTQFFGEHSHPELQWMHDLACKRYGAAAGALIVVARDADALDEKHLVNSIAKLAAVAESRTRDNSAEGKALANAADDQLELIDVQIALRTAINAAAPVGAGYPRAPSVDAFVAAHATGIKDRPAFARLLRTQLEQLLAGRALGVEDVVDVLTLKDNAAEPVRTDPATALEQLTHAAALPEGRKQVAIISIWRRVFIADDWAEIGKTAGRSEEKQRQMQAQTLLYATLRGVEQSTIVPSQFILSPAQATSAPLRDELAARFPQYAPGAVDELLADHAREICALEGLIKDAELDARAREVRALVVADLARERAGAGAGTGTGAGAGAGAGGGAGDGLGDVEME